MIGPLTIDASVFARATIPGERDSESSELFLRLLGATEVPVFLPTLAKAEVAAAVRRGTGDARFAAEIIRRLERLPGTVFVPVDDALVSEAIALLLATGLGGADSVYVAVAQRYDAALISLDNEQRSRVPNGMKAFTPQQLVTDLHPQHQDPG